MTLRRNINAINIMRECHSRNNRRAQSPTDVVILSHPDYHRRLQNYTGSADLRFITKDNLKRSARGLHQATRKMD